MLAQVVLASRPRSLATVAGEQRPIWIFSRSRLESKEAGTVSCRGRGCSRDPVLRRAARRAAAAPRDDDDERLEAERRLPPTKRAREARFEVLAVWLFAIRGWAAAAAGRAGAARTRPQDGAGPTSTAIGIIISMSAIIRQTFVGAIGAAAGGGDNSFSVSAKTAGC